MPINIFDAKLYLKNKSHDRICFPDNIIIETLLHNNLQTESHTPPHSPKTPQHNFLGIIILFFFSATTNATHN